MKITLLILEMCIDSLFENKWFISASDKHIEVWNAAITQRSFISEQRYTNPECQDKWEFRL